MRDCVNPGLILDMARVCRVEKIMWQENNGIQILCIVTRAIMECKSIESHMGSHLYMR